MLALYANERNWLALSDSGIPQIARAVGTVGWEAFLALAPAAECGVIAVAANQWVTLSTRVRVLREALPLLPLVLLAEPLAYAGVFDVADGHVVALEMPLRFVTLWPAIQRACTAALLAETALAVQARFPNRRSLLRRSLVLAVRDREPCASVADLASRLGCDRRTLWAHWHAELSTGGALTLPHALDWLLLVRGFLAHTGGRPWSRIATDFGVDRHTLSRVSSALTGTRLRNLTVEAGPQLRSAYRAALLGAFATSGRPHGASPASTRHLV